MKIFILVSLLLAAIVGPACTGGQISEAQRQLQAVRVKVLGAQERVDAMPDGPEKDKATKALLVTKKHLAELEVIVGGAEDTGDLIERTGEQASKYLSPEYATWALLGSGLLAGLVREIQQRQKSRAISQITRGVDDAKDDMDDKTRASTNIALDAVQSKKTKKLVAMARAAK